MVGTNDIIIPQRISWLNDPAAQHVCQVIADAGHDIFFVGGCVRNALLNLPDSDVDMSTNARPEEVIKIATAAGLKAIPTGIDHGTITVIVQGTPFEITTFRRDVATDGRRAVVAFSNDIADDARRRDFTMNALYATKTGELIDPLGGLPDLLERRIRFIEDPDARIKEDYLRILRFFRFAAWYGDQSQGFEPETLAAISANTQGLETLSGERVGQEMAKLLAAPDPSPSLAVMRQTGVLGALLPGADDRLLALLVHMEGALGVPPNWITRLAVLGGESAADRLRLSKADARKLSVTLEQGFGGVALHEIAYRFGEDIAQATVLIRAALAEVEPDTAVLETISKAVDATFPIKASDLMPAYQGSELGQKLKALEQKWVESSFMLTKQELLGNA